MASSLSPSTGAPSAWTAADSAMAALFASLLAASLVLPIASALPAQVDYANHLARMWVLARLDGPDANPFYGSDWGFYPNLAMDLIVPPLGRWIGVEAATKAFLVAGLVLVATGAAAIEWVWARRFGISGLVALVWMNSEPFAYGFLNFVFALGLALWGIAAWLALARRGWLLRLGLHVVLVAALSVGHLVALGIYGFALGVVALRDLRTGGPTARNLGTFAVLAAPMPVVAGLLLAGDGASDETGVVWLWRDKLFQILIVNSYSMPVSLVTVGVLTMAGYVLAREGKLRFDATGRWLAVGFALLYVAMPYRLLDSVMADTRLLPAAAMILPAFLQWRLPARAPRVSLVAVLAALALAGILAVVPVQRSHDAEAQAVLATFAQLPPHPRILVAHSATPDRSSGADPDGQPVRHLAVLAVRDVDAFVTVLFAAKGKQPILPRPEFASLDAGLALPSIDTLAAIGQGARYSGLPAAMNEWLTTFDALYVIGPVRENPLPGALTAIGHGRSIVAYRIVPPRAPAGR
ncbi:hypothetical protein ASF39_02555 [Methylobacterium sp. Leaf108]|nr:hypothetical protein ASF39_02555 [Methylobacterium sp. Leaf108]